MSIKGMALPKGGNKLPLLLGLCFGLMAAIGVVVLLSGSSDKSSSTAGSGTAVEVVVAARNIDPGTAITADMVTLKSFPEGNVLTNAFNTTDAVVGQIATVPLIQNEQIIASKVTSDATAREKFGTNPPPALILPKGLRGVSVEVSSLIGAGGLIRPGDKVDVILSVKTRSPENQYAKTVLQNVQVLAIDQSVTTTEAEVANADTAKKSKDTATTLTLALTPIQAEIAAVADTCRVNFDGRLAVSLRPFGDDSTFAERTQYAGGERPDCASLLGFALSGQ